MVYVKPTSRSLGIGVFRIEQTDESDIYHAKWLKNKKDFKGFEQLYKWLQYRTKNQSFLIQTGIHLLRWRNRPFDLRIMVQKNAHNDWEMSGIICRIAHAKKIVTNIGQGGSIADINQIFSDSKVRLNITRNCERVAKEATRTLASRLKKLRETGVDIALDQNYKPWILEINTYPEAYIFRRLRDKTMYQNIVQQRLRMKFKKPYR